MYKTIKPNGVGASGNQKPTLHTRAGHFSSPPTLSKTSSWCGSKDDWVPSCQLAGARTLHIWSSLLQVWELAPTASQDPVPCRQPFNHHRHRGRAGELRARPPAPGQHGGLRCSLPAKGRVPEAFVSAPPAPAPRAHAPGARCAPARSESERPNWARKMDATPGAGGP